MKDEQIKEVMRLCDRLAADMQKAVLGASICARADLETHLRTIGEPAGYSLPVGSIGAKKFAQVGGGFTPVGLVFSRGESAMAITEHGRVYWDRDLVHPISGEPESVNAELLDALKAILADGLHCDVVPHLHRRAAEAIARAESAIESSPKPVTFPAMKAAFRTTRVEAGEFIMAFKFRDIEDMDRADDEWRAVMAIETPANVGPCAGHAVQQEAELRQIVGIKEAIAGIHEFFDSECHSGITGIVDTSKVCGDRVEDECRPTFDHCYVNQGGGGITGYDFHGTVYFHIGNGEYATVDY